MELYLHILEAPFAMIPHSCWPVQQFSWFVDHWVLIESFTDTLLQFAELSNAKTHLILRNLRPAGTKQRAIPYGYGFNWVSCPNYTLEIIAWLSVCAMTGSYAGQYIIVTNVSILTILHPHSAWLFLFAGSYFMVIWAIKKHRNYKKEFGSNYPRRKIIIPFVY